MIDDQNHFSTARPQTQGGTQQQSVDEDDIELCSTAGLTSLGNDILLEAFFAIHGNNKASVDDLPKPDEIQRQQRQRRAGYQPGATAPLEEIEAAVEAIPNENLSWDDWNNVGMAVFNACGRSDDGFKIFDKFSAKYSGYNATDTADRWKAYHRSPPDRSPPDGIGMGSLVYLANEADPDWRDNIKKKPKPLPIILDAGDDHERPSPRQWLLRNIFCREFLSSLLGDGGVGKTALRYVQYVSLATGRSLTGDHIFQRCRVLIISLEDSDIELRRRIWALRLHYNITEEELKGWLFLWAPKADDGKLMELDRRGNLRAGDLKDSLELLVAHYKLDIVGIDPFVKSHSVGENDNAMIDKVVGLLTDICHKFNIAIDVPHHVNKAQNKDSEPGDANRGRGASAMKDAARLVYTLNVMAKEEAEKFGINEEKRHAYVRMDKGKVNILPPARKAKWFHLIGVQIGNGTEMYPNGDEVQVVESWIPPDVMFGLTNEQVAEVLDRIEKGMEDGRRYTHVSTAKARAAWKVVVDVEPKLNEKQAKDIIKTWLVEKALVSKKYENPETYKEEDGLWKMEDTPF
jgi:AAA domain/Primase C terminal 2 (PriCT-2)